MFLIRLLYLKRKSPGEIETFEDLILTDRF